MLTCFRAPVPPLASMEHVPIISETGRLPPPQFIHKAPRRQPGLLSIAPSFIPPKSPLNMKKQPCCPPAVVSWFEPSINGKLLSYSTIALQQFLLFSIMQLSKSFAVLRPVFRG